MISITKDQVGYKSERVVFEVEKGAIKKFAEAIGETNPIYYDDDFASQSKWGAIIAPPTFPTVFRDRQRMNIIDIPGTRLHGSQSYEYMKPIKVGMKIACETIYKDLYSKQSSKNNLVFAIYEQEGINIETKEIIFIGTQTSIFRQRSESLEKQN